VAPSRDGKGVTCRAWRYLLDTTNIPVPIQDPLPSSICYICITFSLKRTCPKQEVFEPCSSATAVKSVSEWCGDHSLDETYNQIHRVSSNSGSTLLSVSCL